MFFRNKESKEISYYNKELLNGRVYKLGNILFMVKNDKAYIFKSNRIYQSWSLPYQEISDRPLPAIGGKLGFRDGTLIQNARDGKIYLISGNKKRLLTAPLADYGFDWSEVIEVSDEEAQFHLDGEDIG